MASFFRQFINSPLQTGALLPSSPALVNEMLRPLNFRTAKTIVELGPGTGIFTVALLKRMRKNTRLIVIEINKEFCKRLCNINDPRLRVICGDAIKLSTFVRSADYVVSGLPLIGFPKEIHESILQQIKKVVKKKYVQFHYSFLGESNLRFAFQNVTRSFVLANVPPAFVYVAKH